MKKRIIGLLFGSLALSLGALLGVTSSDKKFVEASAYYTPSTHYEVSDTASELASYYSSISDNDTGTSLLSKLQSLNSTKRKRIRPRLYHIVCAGRYRHDRDPSYRQSLR